MTKKNLHPSLRRRLIRKLLLTLSLVWLGTTAIVLWGTFHEVEEVYQDQIRHLAFAIANTIEGDGRSVPVALDQDFDRDYFVTAEKAGNLIYRTDTAPTLIPRHSNETWHVATAAVAERQVVVTVGLEVSEPLDLALNVATTTALPMLAGLLVVVASTVLVVMAELRPIESLRQAIVRRSPVQLDPLDEEGVPIELLPFLQGLNALLSRLAKSIEQEKRFVADASHELRTPMAAIKAHLQNLDPDALDTHSQLTITKVSNAVERAARLSQQLLILARSQANAAVPDQIVDLAQVLREPLVEAVPDMLKRGGDVQFWAEPARVRADPIDVQIIVRNLVENAVWHTGPGTRVDVSTGTDGGSAWLRVEDSGPGVPEEELAHLFERFRRGQNAIGPGSGLGLSIVRSLVDKYGATLHVSRSALLGGLGVAIVFQAVTETGNKAGASPAFTDDNSTPRITAPNELSTPSATHEGRS